MSSYTVQNACTVGWHMHTRKTHWEGVYSAKSPQEVSWYEEVPAVSLQFIHDAHLGFDEPIIDVGGGASRLVEFLLAAGHTHLAVLDISAHALALARERLGDHASEVEWFDEDVTWFEPPHRFSLWHDRAVFHFLAAPADRQRYVEVLKRTLGPRGHVIIATFALDGPSKCSGLDVVRYDAPKLMAELGDGFNLVAERKQDHVTPAGGRQSFAWFRLTWMASLTS